MKKLTQSNNNNTSTEQLTDDAKVRRAFIEKFGKLAMITPVAVTTLMSPSTSAAPRSGCNKNQKGCR